MDQDGLDGTNKDVLRQNLVVGQNTDERARKTKTVVRLKASAEKILRTELSSR